MSKALAIALQPTSPTRRLDSLAMHDDPQVRAALASNPNVSVKTLLKLLDEFTTEVLGNPALSLALLERPTLFRRASAELHTSWARNERMPAWLLEQIEEAGHERALVGLMSNPMMPVERLERLAFAGEFTASDDEDEDEDDWEHEPQARLVELLDNPALPDGLRFDAVVAVTACDYDPDFSDLDPDVVRSVLDLDGLEQESVELERTWGITWQDGQDEEGVLLYRDEQGVYRQAQASESDEQQWAMEPGDEERGVDWAGEDVRTVWGMSRKELATNDSTPPRELRRLARSADRELRTMVASHPGVEVAELVRLAQDAEPAVRWAAATNRAMPAAALGWLAQDESAEIRRAVANNPATDGETLARLARDRRPSVARVAERLAAARALA